MTPQISQELGIDDSLSRSKYLYEKALKALNTADFMAVPSCKSRAHTMALQDFVN